MKISKVTIDGCNASITLSLVVEVQVDGHVVAPLLTSFGPHQLHLIAVHDVPGLQLTSDRLSWCVTREVGSNPEHPKNSCPLVQMKSISQVLMGCIYLRAFPQKTLRCKNKKAVQGQHGQETPFLALISTFLQKTLNSSSMFAMAGDEMRKVNSELMPYRPCFSIPNHVVRLKCGEVFELLVKDTCANLLDLFLLIICYSYLWSYLWKFIWMISNKGLTDTDTYLWSHLGKLNWLTCDRYLWKCNVIFWFNKHGCHTLFSFCVPPCQAHAQIEPGLQAQHIMYSSNASLTAWRAHKNCV